MRKPYFCTVIGKGFGDEGKGMAVDFLSSYCENVLVIRHNGGAQSGHTVELPDKRFVFHELSSGSFRYADTFWADTFYPDLYKLGEELEDFRAVAGFVPDIYAHKNTRITIIDDVLINMAAEQSRGNKRHGSCGMGIYEAQCRSDAGFDITIGELLIWNTEELFFRLQEIRRNYLPIRLKELGLEISDLGEYGEMLQDDNILENVATLILENIKNIKPVEDLATFIYGYNRVIFENGQGLLLDSENETYSPHVTASRTGLTNPCEFLHNLNASLDEVVYVTRSYVTRHGAGPLPNECSRADLGIITEDRTNIENPWQGNLRYARHEDAEEFVAPVRNDLENLKILKGNAPTVALMITHLNETNQYLKTKEGDYSVEKFCQLPQINQTFSRFYLSSSCYGADIIS